MRMRIKRDIRKEAALFAGESTSQYSRWRGVPSGSLNPDPISDQNMTFSLRFYALVVPFRFQTKTAQKAYSLERYIAI